jgi:hypothetical protein
MKIEFKTTNDAFCLDGMENFWTRAEETVRILNEIILKVESCANKGIIQDINGNDIGEWSF